MGCKYGARQSLEQFTLTVPMGERVGGSSDGMRALGTSVSRPCQESAPIIVWISAYAHRM